MNFQINLREYIIQGGIYSIMFVRRPEQTEFSKFNIVWHEDDRLLHTMPQLVADTRLNKHATEMVRRSRATLASSSNAKLEDSDLPFFHVSIELPPDLCRWSEPEVCHYLTEMQLVPAEPRRTVTEWGASSDQNTRNSISSNRQTTRLSVDSSTNIFRPSNRTLLRHTSYTDLGNMSTGLVLKDFTIKDRLLSHLQVRNVERHAIPRMISSFKFPADFLDGLPELEVSTTKKGLFKRQETEVVTKRPELSFDYESQLETPERMFPYFPHVERVQRDEWDDSEDSDGPQELTFTGTSHTIHQLIQDLDDIKVKYRAKPYELLNQPDEPEKKLAKEKVKEEVGPDGASAPKKDDKEPMSTRRRTKRSVMNRPELESRGSDKLEEVTHWTTKHIIDPVINKVTHTLTFKTDRLGIIGLAFKRYDHFPFSEWSLQPNEEK